MVDLNLASRHLTVPLLSLCTWILSSSYVSVSRACQRLPVWLCVVFSPYFLRAPEVEEFKREKPTSHTHLSLKTFFVSRGNMGSTLALRHFPSRSDFEKAMSHSCNPAACVWPSLSYVSRLPVWPVSKLHHARLSQKSEPGLYSSRILRTHMRLWISGVAVPECSDQEKHNMITYPCAKKYFAGKL